MDSKVIQEKIEIITRKNLPLDELIKEGMALKNHLPSNSDAIMRLSRGQEQLVNNAKAAFGFIITQIGSRIHLLNELYKHLHEIEYISVRDMNLIRERSMHTDSEVKQLILRQKRALVQEYKYKEDLERELKDLHSNYNSFEGVYQTFRQAA